MKKTLTGLMVCTLGLVLASPIALAEGAATSKGKIQFESGGEDGDNKTPNPNPDPGTKDPSPNPDPKDPLDPTEPGNNGPLKFTSLPEIDFGKVELAPFDQYYYAQFEELAYTPADYKDGDVKPLGLYPSFLTVQDLRGGAKGWDVTVMHDGTFTKVGSKDTIKAFIDLKDTTISTSTFKGEDIAKFSPKSAIQKEYVSISSGSAVNVLSATKGTGYGKWSVGFGNTDIKTTGLGLDGNQEKGGENKKKSGLNPSVRLSVPTQIIETDDDVKYETILNWDISTAK